MDLKVEVCRRCFQPFFEEGNHEFSCLLRHSGDLIVDEQTIGDVVELCYSGCKCMTQVAHLTDVILSWDEKEERERDEAIKKVGIYVKKSEFCFVGNHTTGEPTYFHKKCDEERFKRMMEDHEAEIELLKL